MKNESVVKEWADALRSGEYKQTINALRTKEGFCCLGVLCEVAVKHGIIPEPTKENEDTFRYGGYSMFPSNDVVTWVGLNTPEGAYGPDKTLSILNDEERLDFNQIADFIEDPANSALWSTE